MAGIHLSLSHLTRLLVVGIAFFLAGCEKEPPPPDPEADRIGAHRFLTQASFGPKAGDIDALLATDIEGWIDAQTAKSASLQLPALRALPRPQNLNELNVDRVDHWFRHTLHGDDQLRQRVAFALSQIFVVSEISALFDSPYALADYYDLLTTHAFGNYRDLLEAITLHPAMGVYLSMLGNQKPNPTYNIRPDENYAREIMQLFSIGLVELNLDGTPKLDNEGQQIPTYDQAVIEGFAHVFTGWNWAGGVNFYNAVKTDENQSQPMQLYPDLHAVGEKQLLNGVIIPSGQTGEEDLADALDNIFSHPNVGPFMAYRLIQRLTTSNPSPGYVHRVATAFNDNGQGVRGDLGAVVKAILLDVEARPETTTEHNGKTKEPLLRLIQLWRAFDARALSGKYVFPYGYYVFGQGPLQSLSVFNFFSPTYAPAGEIRDAGLVAPELQLSTEFQNAFVTNYFFSQAFDLHSEKPDLEDDHIFIDISAEIAIAHDVDALIEQVADKLTCGQLSPTLHAEIRRMLLLLQDTDTVLRTAETIYLIVTSPEFATEGA